MKKRLNPILAVMLVLGCSPLVSAAEVHWYQSGFDAHAGGEHNWRNKGLVPDTQFDNGDYRVLDVLKGQPEQKIDGFGGAFNEKGWDAMSGLTPAQRQKVLNELFSDNGLHLNIGRLPIGANDFAMDYYSYDDVDGDYDLKYFSVKRDERYLLPYVKAALKIKPNLELFGSPWTPPAWMKANKHYGCKASPATAHLTWDTKTQNSYAQYFVKYVEAYAKEGVKIDAVHLQNEPAACQDFPSSLWNGKQMHDFLKDYMFPAFHKANLKTDIWLGTINHGDYEAYAKPTLTDPTLAKEIGGVGYQWDGKYAIAATHQRHPDVKLMQTESECGDGSNDLYAGFYTFSLMKKYFDGGANSYVYWNMVLDGIGNSTWGWRQNSLISIDRAQGSKVKYNFEFYVMKHFSHFIQQGAKKIATDYDEDLLLFKNPDGEYVAVVANPSYSNRHVTIKVGDKMVKVTIPTLTINTFTIKA